MDAAAETTHTITHAAAEVGEAAAPGGAADGRGDRVERAEAALATVLDPELGLDIVALGLVYRLEEVGDALEADITLTTPGCPVSETLPFEAEEALRAALPGVEVRMQVVWDPPWTTDRIAEETLERLGIRPSRRSR